MAKTTSNVSAVADKSPAANPKTTAQAPKPNVPEPKQPEAPKSADDRPLVAKARRFLLAMLESGKPMTSKELQLATKTNSSDISSYMGSIGDGGRYGDKWAGRPVHEYWDHVARRGDTSWKHVSLLGRKLCSFKKEAKGKPTFSLTKEGEKVAKEIKAEAAKS